ncbi:hypothetical protein GCM10025778_29000 [Paeniglutamicibacter antarcticus]|uniref:Uncharacterized protein n=1 Tax=Paeniglutamicibacter antarcticus TaxID=494023 RepID=A0ABP9TNV7_9MICC
MQKPSPAETIHVLMGWASGAGLPAGYVEAIYSYAWRCDGAGGRQAHSNTMICRIVCPSESASIASLI